MNLIITDTVQTTGGPLAPKAYFEDERMLYGWHNDMVAVPFANPVPTTQYVNSVVSIELSAKARNGFSCYAFLPWDYFVMLADGDMRQAHELCSGDKVAYFTRIMRHEKYSAMRVTPFMKDRYLEHRWVWEQHSGMDIPDTHSIDHIDNDSYNNAYTNLRSLSIRSHSKMTAHRQRNRHTRRNADGSFAKGSTTTRVASADKPIPDSLFTGSLSNTCRVLGLEEVKVDTHFFSYDVGELNDTFLIMGNLLVQPNI